MTIAWLQCHAGASGDMFLGALVDAGVPLDTIRDAVDRVGVEPIPLVAEIVQRGGIAATQVHVRAPATSVVRTWANIRSTLEVADLAEPVRARALDVFERLARAEAAAHRTSPEQVRFHEVGALDAIADVVGAAAGLHALGISRVVATPVAVGHGMVRGDHGLMPVPGPAVVALLQEVHAPTYSGDAPHELCTPTGAAILASIVDSWGGMPLMRPTSAGAGAGSRDLDELPNALRIVLGEEWADSAEVTATAVLLEANIDDLDPRLWPSVLQGLMDAGASDAWLTPILMKKGRPAHTLSVLVAHERAEDLRRAMFVETSTIGLRETVVGKRALDRRFHVVVVDGAQIRVKLAVLDGAVTNVQPEYEDVLAAAEKLGRPVKSVLAAAVAAAADRSDQPSE